MRKSPHIFYSCVSVSYQLEGPPPCSCPPASSRGRRRRLCTTPTHKHTYQMRRQEGQEHYRDLLQEYRKKKRKRVKSSRNITKKTEEKRVLKKKIPGLHLRVRIVLILVLFWVQKLPSVYTSLMSFPVLVFWGEERKLPRLIVLLFLSE